MGNGRRQAGGARPRGPRHVPESLDVDALLDDPATRIIVCCGSGGVGKTTVSAALGVRAAERGRRAVVLTIDPARRLAQSMGLTTLDNTPRRVEGLDLADGGLTDSNLTNSNLAEGNMTDGSRTDGGPDESAPNKGARPDHGLTGHGELHAMMLDMKRTFDEVVLAHADPERAQQILANPFYQSLSAGFAGTQEYMAMEKLGQLRSRDEWDLIIVDTPPSRSALDFLDAPERLGSFLDGRLIRLLSGPAKMGGRAYTRLLSAGVGLVTGTLSRLLGAGLLSDVQTFVAALDTMFGGFRERADATYRLLKSPGTAFVVVAAPETDALREASYFVDRLSAEGMPLAGLVLNRVHRSGAEALSAERSLAAAERQGEQADSDETATEAALTAAILRLHAERMRLIAREGRLRDGFVASHPDVRLVQVPARSQDVHDLAGLHDIALALAKPV